MKFCDLIKTIWENIVTEKSYFIKTIIVNVLVCLMYLVIPASLKTFLGVIFASIGENSMGVYEYLENNLLIIENVISALIAFILVICCVLTLISALSTLSKDNKIYKLQQRFGMSPVSLCVQSLIQNVAVCIVWNLIALMFAELFVVGISTLLNVSISITIMYFVILLFAEVLIVVIASILNYLAYLDNTKS